MEKRFGGEGGILIALKNKQECFIPFPVFQGVLFLNVIENDFLLNINHARCTYFLQIKVKWNPEGKCKESKSAQ